jgi:uncharacterized 2Fe-2S/4Fe-4S cluster protein (DUF4445 family)
LRHFQVHFEPDHLTIKVHHGATLLEAAGIAGIIVSNPCGGIGRCGKCKVILQPSGKEVTACQYKIEHDVTVEIPDTSRYFKQRILEHGISRDVLAQPSIRKIYLDNPPATPEELCNAVSDVLGKPCGAGDFTGTFETAPLTVVAGWSQTANEWRLLGIEPGDTTPAFYGLAIDIGTTSVVARLTDLNTAKDAATVSASNPQSQYGADVVSRIKFAESAEGRETLQQSIVECLNELIAEAANKTGIATDSIYEMVIAGNTTMNHLLLKYPVSQLGQAPYAAHSVVAANTPPADLGLLINPAGNVHTIANIAGFVGSDTVAAALACGLDICKTPTLLVDIGTNGEIVCCSDDHLTAASCAAGPALEGAGIEFGSRAQAGAIERVIVNEDDIDLDVIGETAPATICGSGLIDAVAVLLDLEMIDETGRFAEADEVDPFLPKNIRRRLTTYNGEPAFVLAGGDDPVLVTQKDVRQFQLANAAIRAGITLLLKNAGLTDAGLGQVLLAGAFGSYIQKHNAVRVGLLPPIAEEKIHVVGNAAGSGAQTALINRLERQLADDLAKKIEYLEIAHQTEFQMVFSECLLFPEK